MLRLDVVERRGGERLTRVLRVLRASSASPAPGDGKLLAASAARVLRLVTSQAALALEVAKHPDRTLVEEALNVALASPDAATRSDALHVELAVSRAAWVQWGSYAPFVVAAAKTLVDAHDDGARSTALQILDFSLLHGPRITAPQFAEAQRALVLAAEMDVSLEAEIENPPTRSSGTSEPSAVCAVVIVEALVWCLRGLGKDPESGAPKRGILPEVADLVVDNVDLGRALVRGAASNVRVLNLLFLVCMPGDGSLAMNGSLQAPPTLPLALPPAAADVARIERFLALHPMFVELVAGVACTTTPGLRDAAFQLLAAMARARGAARIMATCDAVHRAIQAVLLDEHVHVRSTHYLVELCGCAVLTLWRVAGVCQSRHLQSAGVEALTAFAASKDEEEDDILCGVALAALACVFQTPASDDEDDAPLRARAKDLALRLALGADASTWVQAHSTDLAAALGMIPPAPRWNSSSPSPSFVQDCARQLEEGVAATDNAVRVMSVVVALVDASAQDAQVQSDILDHPTLMETLAAVARDDHGMPPGARARAVNVLANVADNEALAARLVLHRAQLVGSVAHVALSDNAPWSLLSSVADLMSNCAFVAAHADALAATPNVVACLQRVLARCGTERRGPTRRAALAAVQCLATHCTSLGRNALLSTPGLVDAVLVVARDRKGPYLDWERACEVLKLLEG